MANLISKKEEFINIKNLCLDIFRQVEYPDKNCFSEQFQFINSFDFELIFDEIFFGALKKLLKNKEESLIYYTINPEPEEYFYYHFNKFNCFKLSRFDNEIEFNNVLMADPGNSPSDAIAINSNILAVFSDKCEWAIIGFREEELALIGFKDEENQKLFFSLEEIESDFFDKLN